MRTLRLSLAGAVILVLSCGLSIGTVAQSDEEVLDPLRPSHFTMTTAEHVIAPGEPMWRPGPGYGQALGNESVAIVDASDPRIGGTWTQVLDIRAFPIDELAGDFAIVWSGVVRIENEDGAWSGSLDGYYGADGATEWNRLEGEGAYEGLTAVFRFMEEGEAYEGVIIPGAPPDYPAPVVAGSEAEDVAAMEEAPAEEASEEAAVDDEAAEATIEGEATATTDESDEATSGTATYIDGQRMWMSGAEGRPHWYRLTMSDDRASGIYVETYEGVGHLYDSDSLRPSIVALDPVTLTNDEGGWAGLQSAVWDDEMGWRLTAWLAGEDAYEGLNLYLHAHRFPVYSEPWMDFDGIIFDGTPPVMLEAVQFPAE